MLATGGGLYVRKPNFTRHWTWAEIFEMELNHYPSSVPTKRTEWTIGLTAAHSGVRPDKPPKNDQTPPAIVSSLEDIYDVPLGEIASGLRVWTDWREDPEIPIPDNSRRLIRLHGWRKPSRDAITSYVNGVFIGAMLATIPVFFLALIFLGEDAPNGVPFLLVSPFFIVAIAHALITLGLAPASWNYLELDGEGLTWRRLGRRRHWTWLELPSFEMRVVKLRWSRKPVLAILFAGHRNDRLSRFVRWTYEIDEALPRIVIEDIYDIPIQEVLSKLVQYRQPPRHGHAPRPKRAA